MQINYHIILVRHWKETLNLKFVVNQKKVYRELTYDEKLFGAEPYDIENDFSKYVYMQGDSLYIKEHFIVNDKYKSNDIIQSLRVCDFSNSTMYVRSYIHLDSEAYKVQFHTIKANSYWKLLLKIASET